MPSDENPPEASAGQGGEGGARNPSGSMAGANGTGPYASEAHALVSQVKALAEALQGSDVSELDLTEGGTRVLIRRRLDSPLVAPRGRGESARRAGSAGRGVRQRGAAEAPAARAPDPTVAVVAPLTGVFYTAPSPASPPFAAVGDPIQAGQIACIIEAMKVFNEVRSEVGGTVTAIVAQNGQLVHKGDALLRVMPI
jgi:acetyl-CoA carboxylase biotin carboxyl carrier protein